MDSNTIQTNIQAIRDAVPEHVTLVAVSKTQPLDAIASAYAEGIRDGMRSGIFKPTKQKLWPLCRI